MKIPAWVPDAIFYQIFPDRFCNGNPRNDPPGVVPWTSTPTRDNVFGGDLEGIIESLDYIRDLGCNALYLNPIFTAASNHKYDTHDYFQVDPAFGDDATFDRLIREAHRRNMRVVLDGVFNHCGLGFGPFQDVVRHGATSAYRGWFDIYDFPVKTKAPPNYATCGGAHYLPRLNTRNPEVETFIHKVAIYWLERGIDGWRLDVPYEIHIDFWRRFRKVVKGSYPDAYLVAEEWRDPWAFLQGDTFDGATHYLLRGLAFDFFIKNALTGEAFARALETLLQRLPQQSAPGMLTLLGGHDTPRVLTECGGDTDLVTLLFAFLLTMPGVPLIYYGDENGMRGENDPDCRRPMTWNEAQWNARVRRSVQQLIALRTKRACLRRGRFDVTFANDRVIAYQRTWHDERILVILNNTRVPRKLSIPVGFPDRTVLRDGLCGETYSVRGGKLEFLSLPPKRAWVLEAASLR